MASPYPYAHLYDELPEEMDEITRPFAPVKVKPLPVRVSEKAFMAQVIELAQRLGWLVYHTHDSRRSTAGYPDLCMVRAARRGINARLLYAELKTARGRATKAQQMWLALLADVPHVEVALWRPNDIQKIAEVLS